MIYPDNFFQGKKLGNMELTHKGLSPEQLLGLG